MSYAKTIKHEISKNNLFDCCKKSQLMALILMSAKLVEEEKVLLQFSTSNSFIAKRVWQLLKDLYDVELSLDVTKSPYFDKANIYQVSILDDGLKVLDDLNLLDKDKISKVISDIEVKKECCKRAYLAGAFMAAGSVNSPKTPQYHLEIKLDDNIQAQFIAKLMNNLNLNANITVRRSKHVVYIKKAEKISDFLRAIGASNGVMEFEEERIARDFLNSFTRLDNCELANEVKIINAGQRHLADIKIIEDSDSLALLNKNHLEVIVLRKLYPEDSLNDLSEKYYKHYHKRISKSGLNHRFKKISEIAEKVKRRSEI